MPFFYELTQETVYDSEDEEDSPVDSTHSGLEPSALETPKEELHAESATVHETPANKPDDTPCPKAKDSETYPDDLPFRSQTPEETPREGLLRKETLATAAAPIRTGNVLEERHFPSSDSSSVKLLLVRRDEHEKGSESRLILEKTWDLTFPVEIGRRVSQSAEITNGLFNDRLISRKHAIVYAEDDKVVIQDVGSSHGTFVNGQRVMTVKELHDGDRLNLGQFSSGKAPYIVQIVRGTGRGEVPGDTTGAERSASHASKKRERELDAVNDVAYFIFDGLENVENRIAKRIRVSSAISAIVGGVVGGLSVGCAIVGLANVG